MLLREKEWKKQTLPKRKKVIKVDCSRAKNDKNCKLSTIRTVVFNVQKYE